MKITIEYKSDCSDIPFCAYTRIGGQYVCQWSSKSFEDAKARLLETIRKIENIKAPESEEIEI